MAKKTVEVKTKKTEKVKTPTKAKVAKKKESVIAKATKGNKTKDDKSKKKVAESAKKKADLTKNTVSKTKTNLSKNKTTKPTKNAKKISKKPVTPMDEFIALSEGQIKYKFEKKEHKGSTTRFNKKVSFESKIVPIIEEFSMLCKKNNLPFYLTVCVSNSSSDSEYYSDGFIPEANGIALHDDRFIKHVNVDLGYKTVLPSLMID